MPGSVVAHGRSLPAAFSAASGGAMASSLSVFSPLGSHNRGSRSSPGPTGVPAALHARVVSGPVENAAADHLETPPPDRTHEEAGNLTPDPAYPLGTYALVKTTSQSQTSKGRIMLVESFKDGAYHLSHIGETAPKRKAKVQEKFLQPIDQSAENIVQYDNLRVHNPTLPAAPPAPLELSTVPDAPPPTPNTAVPEQRNQHLASLLSSRLSLVGSRQARPHSTASLPPSLPLRTSTFSDKSGGSSKEGSLYFRQPSRTCESPTPSAQSEGASDGAGDRAEPPSQLSTAAQTPAPRRVSTASLSVASTSSAASRLSAVPPGPARSDVLHVPSKRPPSKNVKDTTLSPLDEQFQPPVAGSVHYRQQGILHVIIAPGVELPAAYDKVIVETAEEAVAIHVAARAAAAAASNVAAAMSRLEAKPSLSSITGMQHAVDDPTPGNTRMRVVLPKSLTSRREQALALQAIADLEREVDLAQQERMVGDAEAANLLEQLEESARANEALSAELAAEHGRREASEARAEELTVLHSDLPLSMNQHLADWALQQKELLDSADVSNQIIADLQHSLALAQGREREATPQNVASLELAVAQWTEAYGALQAGSEEALRAERTASEEILTGYRVANEDLTAEYQDLEARTVEALKERQSERVMNEEILTSYRDANTNYAAEYQRLETHSGQLEDKLAAAEVRLQLRSTDEEMTPQEPWLALQAERIQHEEILVGFREAYDGVVAEYEQLGVQTSQLETALTSANEQTTRLEQRLEDAVQKLVAQDGVASEEVKLENERLATELATSEHEAGVLEDHLGDARHEMATLQHAHQSALQLQLEAAAADWEMQKAALQQAHQSALQLQLEAAAADCEVHKAALQQELTDLRSRTAEMQDDSLYDARQELANLQQELAESQANAGLLRQCVAELSDALALQAKQSREQRTSFETELRLLEDRRLQEGRDSLKERAAFQSDLDQGAALHQVDKDHLGAMLQESNANLHQSQQLADSLQRAANMLQERLESQSSTISVTRRELAASKVQKEAAEKECHEALEELGATRTDHSEEVSRLQADISSKKSLAATVTRLENECERLRADNRSSAEEPRCDSHASGERVPAAAGRQRAAATQRPSLHHLQARRRPGGHLPCRAGRRPAQAATSRGVYASTRRRL